MNTELLNCPFERGQVWKNPDDMLMMVIMVDLDESGWVVDYVTERGQKGWFNNLDRAIIENCELLHCATPQIDVEKLKRNSCHYFRKTGQYCSDGCFVCEQDIGYNQAIDHLAAQYDFVPKNGGK